MRIEERTTAAQEANDNLKSLPSLLSPLIRTCFELPDYKVNHFYLYFLWDVRLVWIGCTNLLHINSKRIRGCKIFMFILYF